MSAYLATPDGEARAAVVVVQEAFGVTPHIESICRRLAEVGYVAIAPALFHRVGSPVLEYGDFEAVRPAMTSLTAGGIGTDLDAVFADLGTRGFPEQRTAIVGFCMGGTVALFAATQWPLAAAVTFYGGGVAQGRFGFPSLLDLAPELRSPWLGLYGDLDQGIPVDEVEALRRVAAKAAVPTEIVRYAEAGHGFNCNDRPDAYHEASAADAWQRTLAWFDRHLG
ncbi:MAG TPA: dienelactone hydrolase family protein [Acidimicrobiia bacterium]